MTLCRILGGYFSVSAREKSQRHFSRGRTFQDSTLVGVKTFGKGIVQTIFPLDAGTSVKLTTAKYLTPNKIDIHKKGIEPDVKVELKKGEDATISPTDKNFDSQLTQAVQVLRGKMK